MTREVQLINRRMGRPKGEAADPERRREGEKLPCAQSNRRARQREGDRNSPNDPRRSEVASALPGKRLDCRGTAYAEAAC